MSRTFNLLQLVGGCAAVQLISSYIMLAATACRAGWMICCECFTEWHTPRRQGLTGCLPCHCACRPYPWGSELLATLKASSPPAVDISMQLLGPVHVRGGQAYSCQITLARQGPAAAAGTAQQTGTQGMWAANSAAAAGNGLPSTSSPCKLLVGCSSTDELLLLRHVVLERMDSPTQVRPPTSHARAGRQHAPGPMHRGLWGTC